MKSDDLRQQRASLLATAKQIINTADTDNRDLSDSERAEYTKVMQDVDGLKLEIEKIERKEKVEYVEAELKATQSRKVAPIAHNVNVVSDEQRKAALANWCLAGTDKFDRSQEAMYNAAQCGINLNSNTLNVRALSKGTTNAGGYTVPVNMMTEINRATKYFARLSEFCRVWETETGADYQWPKVDDTSNQAAIVTEGSGIGTTTDPTFGQVTFKAQWYRSPIVKVSQELLQDSVVNIEGLLADLLVERIARKREDDGVNGAGGGSAPNGLITGATSGVALASGNAITFAKLKALEHSVDISYRQRGAFLMHDSTLSAIEQLADSQLRPLFLQNLNDPAKKTLFGYPIYVSNAIPNYSGNEGTTKPMILFGDFNQFVLRNVTGDVTLTRYNELYAGNGQVGFLLSMRGWNDYVGPSGCIKYLSSI